MNDLICGHIQKRRVRCGKQNCKCANGEKHTAFYHVWNTDGRRYQKYIRRSQVEAVRKACLNYRQLQVQLRAGRNEYKILFSRMREILKGN